MYPIVVFPAKMVSIISSAKTEREVANERKTEALVRDKLLTLGYNQPDNGITVEEQKSEIARIKTLLSKASKNEKGNIGYPEFIISNRKDTGFLIVFECKPNVKKHQSPSLDVSEEFVVVRCTGG